ncbi:hypothetical protein [Chitinophaga silvisoli]|uniref:Uncharacterized protein n=1 Tax=Chitinophaga silvisoli TaxID=2291814 RepID=A0A3E1P2J4_9BACT|nr:hypothetical protein [Chitinophaga silvisoli]RFM34409.1 hypothetical protein DXN04_14095 [Chitinophaga silvisoli]
MTAKKIILLLIPNWMIDFRQLDDSLNRLDLLAVAKYQLAEKIFAYKKVKFDAAEIEEHLDILTENKIIVEQSGNYLVGSENGLCYYFFTVFRNNMNLHLDATVNSIVTLFEKCDQFFSSGDHDASDFLHHLYQVTTLFHQRTYKPDYSTLAIYRENTDFIFSFYLNSIFEAFSLFELTSQEFAALINNLLLFLKYEDNVLDLQLMTFQQSIRQLTYSNPLLGREIANTLEANLSKKSVQCWGGIWNVLLMNSLEDLPLFLTKSDDADKLPFILEALTGIDFPQDKIEPVDSWFQGLGELKGEAKEKAPAFILSLLHCKATSEWSRREDYLNVLYRYANDSKPSIIHALLSRLLRFPIAEKNNLLLEVVGNEALDQRLLSLAEGILGHINDVLLYFSCVRKRFSKVLSSDAPFIHTARNLRHSNPGEFDKQLVTLLIDNSGRVRLMANRILGQLRRAFDSVTKLHFDVLTLDAKSQFKFFTSVLSEYLEPKYSLPLILDLVNSGNEVVREALICRLELLTEDYSNLVKEAIKNYWPVMSNEQQKLYNRVENYSKEFYNELHEKNLIRELDPFYTQMKYYKAFMSKYGKSFNQGLTKTVEQKSVFHKLFTKVEVAKGGGWKMESSNEISKFTTFSASMVFPRTLFINQDLFEYLRLASINEDWSNFLPQWIVTN